MRSPGWRLVQDRYAGSPASVYGRSPGQPGRVQPGFTLVSRHLQREHDRLVLDPPAARVVHRAYQGVRAARRRGASRADQKVTDAVRAAERLGHAGADQDHGVARPQQHARVGQLGVGAQAQRAAGPCAGEHAAARTPDERGLRPGGADPDPGTNGRQPYGGVSHGERALLARSQGQERPVHSDQHGARRAVDLGHRAHDGPGYADAARGGDAAAIGQGADIADRQTPPAAVERNEIVKSAEAAGHRLAAHAARRELQARDTTRDFCTSHHELCAFIQDLQFPLLPPMHGTEHLSRQGLGRRTESIIWRYDQPFISCGRAN